MCVSGSRPVHVIQLDPFRPCIGHTQSMVEVVAIIFTQSCSLSSAMMDTDLIWIATHIARYFNSPFLAD